MLKNFNRRSNPLIPTFLPEGEGLLIPFPSGVEARVRDRVKINLTVKMTPPHLKTFHA
jgi:hypothetical protein